MLFDFQNVEYKKTPVDFVKKTQNQQEDWSHYDIRQLRYPLGEKYPNRLIGNDEVKVVSENITKILREKLSKIGIDKTIIVKNHDIRKVIDSIVISRAYLTPEQVRRDAIAIIVSQIMDLYETIDTNFKLDPEVILYTGKCGIISHGPIKIKEKKRASANFWIY